MIQHPMKPINLKNQEFAFRIDFENKIYNSSGFYLGKIDDISLIKKICLEDDEINEEVRLRDCKNKGLLIRFYDPRYLRGHFKDNSFEDIPYQDLLLKFEGSNSIKHFEQNVDGFSVLINGYYYVDLPIDNFLAEQANIGVIMGFYGSYYDSCFFSPLIGHDESDPSTWQILSRNGHRIKVFNNLRSIV